MYEYSCWLACFCPTQFLYGNTSSWQHQFFILAFNSMLAVALQRHMDRSRESLNKLEPSSSSQAVALQYLVMCSSAALHRL